MRFARSVGIPALRSSRRRSWAWVWERRWPDWEIINASVSGWGTDDQVAYLEIYQVGAVGGE